MRRRKRIILACLLLALATFGAEATRTAPGVFTSCKSPSARTFAAKVKKDPKLSALYSKHFRKSPQEVVSFFETLKLTRLKKSKRVSSYGQRGGKIFKRTRTLPAGKLVFATETGVPILDWGCGNPLITVLPPPKTFVEKMTETPAAPTVKVAAAPVQELVPTVVALPATALPAAAIVNPIPDATLPPLAQVATAPSVGASISSRGFFLPLIPFGGGHKHRVPEAGSLPALVIGLTMLGAHSLRLKRARR